MRLRLVIALAVAVLAAAAVGGAAGYVAGHRAAATEQRAVQEAATSARQAAEQAAIQARAENSLAEIARAGGEGVCWSERRGHVGAIAAPIVRPGGETCPRAEPRFTPADPQPVGRQIGAPGA